MSTKYAAEPPMVTGRGILTIVGVVVGLFLVWEALFGGIFGYFLHDVAADEVGVKMQSNRPYEIVGPGKYTNFGFFESMTNVKVREIPFMIYDPEVLTADKQRVGMLVSGTVHRPGWGNPQELLENYGRFKAFYTDDLVLIGKQEAVVVRMKDDTGKDVEQKMTVNNGGLMETLGKQASKVCTGDSSFEKAVIGKTRDDLSGCINEEMTKLGKNFGVTISNAMVPNFVLSKAVQDQLDAITQSRFASDVANQNAILAKAKADQTLAEQQGQIRVEQGKIQEKAVQDARTADLQRKALEAQNAVITAEKANTLLTAQKDKEIAEVQRQVAETNAQASIAPELAKAKVFESNPQYTNYLNVQNQSNALKSTDKVMVVPQGTNPIMSFGQNAPAVIVPSKP